MLRNIMEKRKLKILLWCLILIATLGVYIFHFAGFVIAYKDRVIEVAIYSILGLLLTSILAPLIHELGHLISGVICGFKLRSFTIGFLKLSFKNKFKISLVKPNLFGETAMLPKSTNNYSKKLRITVFSGLIFSLALMLVQMTVLFLCKDLTLVLLFGLPYHLSTYLLVMNLIPFSETSDGYLLFTYYVKGGIYKEIIDNALSVSAEIYLGTRPESVSSHLLTEFSPKYDYYSVLLKYYRYLAFLCRDEDFAFKVLFDISDLDKIPESLYETVYKELFFASIVRGDDNFIRNNEDIVIGYLEKEESPSDYRIHATYRMYKGDGDWARLIVKSGLKNLSDSDGITKFEKNLLEAMNNAY